MNNVFFGLRKVQKETYDTCIEKKYGIVSDTCGSGKSRVEFELMCNTIMNNLDSKAFIVLAAHRLDLIDQHIRNFYEYLNEFHPELIGEFNMFEISSANRKDKKIESTTRKGVIQNFVIGTVKPTIITVCYHSIERLYEAFYGSEYRINLMICDEGHYGMSGQVRDNEKVTSKINKYDCVKFCDSFIVFSATPFKQTMCKNVDGILIDVIHDYSYAEAVKDGIVLPVHANFYEGLYSDTSVNGMVSTAYEDLKEQFTNTSAKLLVCGTCLEKNQILFNSLIKKYRKEIESGVLAIAKIGSEGLTEDDELIPSCEWVDGDQLMRFSDKHSKCITNFGYKICPNDDRKNKSVIMEKMHDWINPKKNDGKHKNIIIIHCQMLGVGVDVPNINGVCILGNKESADLYQSIMRPCRIAYYDRNVDESERLEDHFEVYIHTEKDVMEAIKEFMSKLIDIGAMSLIDAMVLNSVSGKHGKDIEELAKAKALFNKQLQFAKVFEECNMIFDINSFEKGFEKFDELLEKYPDEEVIICEQRDKFIRKFA